MSGPLTTYNALVSAVVEALEDDSSEFAAYIPTAVDLAERRLEKEVDTDGMVVVTTITATASAYIIPKPSGFRFGRDLEALVSGQVLPLKKKVNSFIRDYWPNPTQTSVIPLYYADYDKDNFIIAPTPTSTTPLYLTAAIRPTRLSAGNQTNIFITEYPDALFYATMANLSEFAKMWDSKQVWEEKYHNAILGVAIEGKRSRKDDDSKPVDNPPGNNTLKGDG
jgi:hypothetical protein